MSWSRLCRRSPCGPELDPTYSPYLLWERTSPLPHLNGIDPLIALVVEEGFLAIYPL